ncbi:MAG: sigma-70 family RNA polymerase sigma factor [Phycisphaerales bacterium]|nr:sigma-70 family RNA polymerase sigma factor [Phycisphaerales bacterium]
MTDGQDDPDPKNTEIARWLAEAVRGDERAWCSLVHEFSPRVFGFLKSQCNDGDLAEELTQSVFVTMAEKLRGYSERGQFESWIFRVAINRLRDELRRRTRHAKPTAQEKLEEIGGNESSSGGASYRTTNPDELALLDRAMDELSRSDREIVDLRHTAELSFKHISALLDEPVGTLLARHHRALARLRASIERLSKGSQ